MKPLYELENQFLGFRDICADPESNLSQEVVNDTLEGLRGDIEHKAINIISLIASLKAERNAVDEAEKKMARRKKTLDSSIQFLTNYVVHGMRTADIKEVSTPEFRASVVKNPVSVQIDCPYESLPEWFTRAKVSVEPDKTAIKAALEEGSIVPGCRLEQGYRLSIR